MQTFVDDLLGEDSVAPSDDNSGNVGAPPENILSKEEIKPSDEKEQATSPNTPYPGDVEDDSKPLHDQYQKLDYPDPASVVEFFDDSVNQGFVTLYPWQVEIAEFLGSQKATAQHPCKYCLIASNGSGKDLFVIAPFAIWFCLCKIKSRVIITSSSGVQLTAQTEAYVKSLAEKVNKYFGAEVFIIRQRYLKCRLSGSEIRMFATDEAGKAEGYHPIEPNREMAIIVNEAKTVSEAIHSALRRCTGYNYWLEISSAGQLKGFLYRAFCTWPNTKVISSYDCLHVSRDEIEKDKQDLGENSALFRSIHLGLFTNIGGEVIISSELVDKLLLTPPIINHSIEGTRVGIDLAAGGDENVIVIFKDNRFYKEYFFREVDTTITAEEIDRILKKEGISKSHEHIYADDGGIGHATIDMLNNKEDKKWNIKRIRNEWAAINKKNYGNRGAENWYRIARLIEEKIIDLTGISDKLKEQLTSRRYKKTETGGRIFLQSKKEAKAEGYPSPDRADALILALTGISIGDIINKPPTENSRPLVKRYTPEELEQYIDDQSFGQHESDLYSKRTHGSLQVAISNSISN